MDDRLAKCVEPGVSVIVGSVDVDGNPSCCRAVGLKTDDELATVTVFLPVATSGDTIANIAATERLAIVTTHPISHCATQLKGVVQRTRPAREDEESFIVEHFAGFGGVLNTIGYPLRVTRAVTHWPAFALEMRVDQIYEQSPGPKAGTRLR
ncbi:MAG TPA: pyridoxamine 5'-phosphate oxidase family protein [Vicinamibacterales bacterium]|nr:pyridoxamine 5'-phosphate oxidase family protein [Vicinamibacterales bacterium]